MWDVAQHVRHYENPELQRHIVRIIWMVPIYSIDSWIALRWPHSAIYMDTVRECYEAYVIYSFYQLLLQYLKQRDPNIVQSAAGRPRVKHLFPFGNVLAPCRLDAGFFRMIHSGPVVYVVFRLGCTFLALVTEWAGVYGEGSLDASTAYVYLTSIVFFTQGWAMYCLVLFFYAFKADLRGARPLPKLLVIKAVVFFSFWQAVLISFLAHFDVIKDAPHRKQYKTKGEIATALQDFLVCFEMFIAALVHNRVFSYREFVLDEEGEGRDVGCREALRQLFDVDDVQNDIVGTFKSVGNINAQPSTPLLGPDQTGAGRGGAAAGRATD